MKTFIYICLLVIGLVFPAGAQVPIQSYRGQVSLKQNRIEAGGQLLASRPNDQCLRTLRGTIFKPCPWSRCCVATEIP